MTIFTSQMISGAVGQQLSMFSGQMGYAQQLSYPMQAAMNPGMPPPPVMPQMNMLSAARAGQGGVYGEQMAARMGQTGMTMMGVAGAGIGLGASMLGADPFSGAMMGARFGLGGAMGGAALGAAASLPLFAATTAARVYGGAFTGGMQDQAAVNSVLRNNFQHFGGQGSMGRGFSQAQMGQIGTMLGSEARNNPLTSMSELSGLVAGGADSGQFTAVRDAQAFSQSFRKMLDTLKSVQKELGGTLTDALSFVRGAQQSGIFQGSQQANFAAEVRGAEAVTGMDRNQLVALSAQGAQISRAFGGLGRQGAMGALRGAQQIGSAIQAGAINQEALSEATGGLTGSDAIASFTQSMMARSGRFSRTPMGRFSLFAMSNGDGTGLDQEMLSRFQAGDLTTGDVSRRARGRVNSMGRARSLNQEGHLRGAMMEQGGLSAQIGMMRLMIGDRTLDQGDDMAQLVMQRRFHMSRPESELMTSLMRNQGSIAEQQSMDRRSATRQQAIGEDVRLNRSVEGFMTNLEHGLQNATGVTAAREMGRTFLTKMSSMAQRAMDDFLGVAGSSLSQGDQRALSRMGMGRVSTDDIARLTTGAATGSTGAMFGQRSAAAQLLHGMGLTHDRTNAETMQIRGIHNFSGMDEASARTAMQQVTDARSGSVTGRDRDQLRRLEADVDGTTRRIQLAQIMARGAGHEGEFHQFVTGGASANSIDAFMSRQGLRGNASGINQGAAMAAGGGSSAITLGMLGRDAGRLALGVGGLMTGGALGLAGAALGLGMGGGLETMAAMRDPDENRLGFIARGGHMGVEARRFAGDLAGDTTRANDIVTSGAFIAEGASRDDRRTHQRARAALVNQGLQVDSGAVQSIMESGAVSDRLRRMQGMTNRDDLMSELSALEREAGSVEDPTQQSAAQSIAAQVRRNIVKNGSIGEEFNVGSSRHDRRRQSELMSRYSEMASGFRGVAGRLEEAGGGAMADLLRTASGRITSFSDGISEDDLTGFGNDMSSFRRQMATMDPASEQYRQMANALGGDETGRGLLGGIAQERQQRRALSGRGRRGRRQAVETAFGMVTGNSLSGMEFTIGEGDNQRVISGAGRNAAGQLAQLMGGEHGESIRRQLQDQLQQSGVSQGEASGLVGALSSGLSEGGRGVGNIDDIIARTGNSTSLQRIQQQQMETRQRQQDPLGVQRNDLLQQIRDGIRNMNPNGGDTMSMPNGESA